MLPPMEGGVRMSSRGILAIVVSVLSPLVTWAQERPPRLPAGATTAPPASVQAPADPGYAALIAACKTPPPAGRGRGGGGGGRGGAQPQPIRDYTVQAIPGVIAAGQKWTFLWQEAGNNGDGIVGTDDGGLLLAQNDNSKVVKLDKDGKPSNAYADTHTGGALSINKKGVTFIVQRGLRATVTQLAPQRRVLANTYQGDPLDCIGGVINDLTADSKGGAYFTMGGVYYADPKGVVTKYGQDVTPNGIVLSADEKTLYVTDGPELAVFDVQADGSLTNQRAFGKYDNNGDGLSIDSMGRVYVTTSAGVVVLSPKGDNLGTIPTPRGVITGAFGGPDKKTFFILARGATDADGNEVANAAQVWSIPMIAQGYRGRPK
jgi:gluconolactonase